MFSSIKNSVYSFCEEVGNIILFQGKIVRQYYKAPFEFKELIKHSYTVGYKTLSLVMITGFIMGVVLTMQSRPVLSDFGAASLLPGMISISIIREIGPVVISLICAGKISSGFGAEIGSMKVTEQLDAMEVSGTNPLAYVVAPRVLATTIMIPILIFIADAVALFGSWVAINMESNISFGFYINSAFKSLGFSDLMPATIKTVVFGFFIGLIGCYKGYNTGRGTASVGKSANSAVVVASLSIFIIDLLAVQLTDFFTKL